MSVNGTHATKDIVSLGELNGIGVDTYSAVFNFSTGYNEEIYNCLVSNIISTFSKSVVLQGLIFSLF